MADSFKLSRDAVKKVAETTRIVLGTVDESRSQTGSRGGVKQPLRRGILDEDLDPDGTATVSVTHWDGAAWVDSGYNIDDVRQSVDSVGPLAEGDVVWLTFHGGVWFVLQSGGSPLKHAIVRACLGNGMYDVEIAEYYPRTPDDDDVGIYGTANVFGEPYCGACITSGDADHGGILKGLGEHVTVQDLSRIPLVIDPLVTDDGQQTRISHCLISKVQKTRKLDEEIDNTEEYIGDIVWMVVSGRRYAVKVPWERWECCTHPITGVMSMQLLERKNFLVEGIVCDHETGDCENPLT